MHKKQITTVCSFKGGTAKTSVSLHLGYSLAKFHEKKVLLVDLDGQANLSTALGFGPDREKTIGDVLAENMHVEDAILETALPNLHLIPSNAYLDGIERTAPLVSDPYAHERLRHILSLLDYDYIFIDIPPSLGWLTQSAFFASSHTLICAIPEAFSILGLRRLKEFHESVNRYHSVELLGIVLSFWDERGAVNFDFLQAIEDYFPGKIFDAKIRRDVLVSRSVLRGLPVFEVNEKSRAAQDYQNLTAEFLQKNTASISV
ncbi:MAG: ParA family protein [Simkaniaceae bacterium]